jgi:N-acetylglutamate synthase-like GNAT family acetyltransferase
MQVWGCAAVEPWVRVDAEEVRSVAVTPEYGGVSRVLDAVSDVVRVKLCDVLEPGLRCDGIPM